jgi:hypothetical protein
MKSYLFASFFLIFSYGSVLSEVFFPFFEKEKISNSARIIYVNTRATGANNGTSWRDAYKSLTDGLANANSGDEIWITWGIYFPTSGNDRNQTFTLKSGIAIYGAFKGTELSVSDRFKDTIYYPTILSGDIGRFSDNTDNSYHVVKGENIDILILDNLEINSGFADGSSQEDKKGGGIYLHFDRPNTTSNITFKSFQVSKSQAELEGGNVYVSIENSAILKLDANGYLSEFGRAIKGANMSINLENNAQCYFRTNYIVLETDTLLSASLGCGIYINNKSKSLFDWKAKDGFIFRNNADKGGGIALITDGASKSNINLSKISF